MRLWLLRPINLDIEDDPWEPWYDKAFGFVVRAETEEKARHLIADDEIFTYGDEGALAWLDPKLSSCVELLSDGEEEIIIRDFAKA